jgi:tagatose 6-phosphate kinase
MILTVTLNAALDVSYGVERLSQGDPVRVRDVSMRAGGKGVNVAFVLATLGTDVTVTGFAGGHRGQLIRDQLSSAGIADAFVPVASESRQTVVVVADDGTFAEYDEPGDVVSASEWDGFVATYRQLLERCSTVVCAGSLAPGVPDTGYATLIALAHDRGRIILLDSSAEGLRTGSQARPDVLKMNRAELGVLAHGELPDEAAVVQWMDRFGGTVVVTLGAEGAVAAADGRRYRLRLPKRRGNPVGAGDAFTAGLVCDDMASATPGDRLAFATALAASAVGLPCAGMVDLEVAKELLDQVEIEEL